MESSIRDVADNKRLKNEQNRWKRRNIGGGREVDMKKDVLDLGPGHKFQK